MNRAQLIGRSGADAEMRYTPNGHPVLSFSIATSEKKGEQFETFWHKITSYGKLAEDYKDRIKKGSKVFVEGKIYTRSWEDKSGNKRSSVEIVANRLNLIDPGKSSSSTVNDNFEDIPF